MKKHKGITVDGKRWIPTIQDWSWIITIVWMAAANFYSPFGLFGFVCMFSPVLIALSGRGKMHCARICPRGSLIGKIGSVVNLGLPRPKLYEKPWFRPLLWSGMMGGFCRIQRRLRQIHLLRPRKKLCSRKGSPKGRAGRGRSYREDRLN